ncbi:hypothetical protein [Burkholderia ubonensis]|uniref:hypothetical protein n=1 Tax=Burkholderia ubonensis TaxID=101571 RepID=UPI0012F9649D|nr:hypothetical protein [Burkholderia ubonensis]
MLQKEVHGVGLPHELSGIDLAIDDGLDETALLKFGYLMVWRDLKRAVSRAKCNTSRVTEREAGLWG